MTLYFLTKYLHVLGAIVLILVALLILDNR
jgi:putative Mn2+ efflux pump MntP